jgi:dUTP pyrophosphatase
MRVLYVSTSDTHLRSLYEEAILQHNEGLQQSHPNSGFDLLLPEEYSLVKGTVKIDHGIKAVMFTDHSGNLVATPYCLYVRSSIYKTPLRLSNNVGIIDSGYRGNLGSVFDVSEPVVLKRGQRLIQVCAPDLAPFRVELVDENRLGNTLRGSGGFGSTGV